MNTTKIFVYGFPELVESTTIGNILLADSIHEQTNWNINYDEIDYLPGCVWDYKKKQFQPGRSAHIYVPDVVTAVDIQIINAAEKKSDNMFNLTYKLAHSTDDNALSNGKDSHNDYYNYGHQNCKMRLSERATYTSKTYVIPQHRQNCITPQSKSHTPIDDTSHITILPTPNTIQPTRAPSIPPPYHITPTHTQTQSTNIHSNKTIHSNTKHTDLHSDINSIAHISIIHKSATLSIGTSYSTRNIIDAVGRNILSKLSCGDIPQNRNHKLKTNKNIDKKSSNRKVPKACGILNRAVTPNKSPPNTNSLSNTIFDTLCDAILDEDENVKPIIINEKDLSQNNSLLIAPTPNHISSTLQKNAEILDEDEPVEPIIIIGTNVSQNNSLLITPTPNHMSLTCVLQRLSTAELNIPHTLTHDLESITNPVLLLALVLISILLCLPSIAQSLTSNGFILNATYYGEKESFGLSRLWLIIFVLSLMIN